MECLRYPGYVGGLRSSGHLGRSRRCGHSGRSGRSGSFGSTKGRGVITRGGETSGLGAVPESTERTHHPQGEGSRGEDEEGRGVRGARLVGAG